MNTQRIRRPLRAAEQIRGARAGRLHIHRTNAIGRMLDTIAPGTHTVRTIPVTIDDTRRLRVVVENALGQPVTADRAAHRAAAKVLITMFPGVEWTAPQRYTVHTGHVTPDAPTAPAALALDTAEAIR
ncbi:hypothetical protein ACIBVM_18585 [[Kitasatospora] papulosa]|uniref:hypothetical protein n=1 Tax=[Kitasatospora] papulosa TaxID=1464011 RepID=UPI0037BACF0D